MNAEKAKLELDRSSFKGRNLNVRLASQSSVIKVSNLGDFVTNELLRMYLHTTFIMKCHRVYMKGPVAYP